MRYNSEIYYGKYSNVQNFKVFIKVIFLEETLTLTKSNFVVRYLSFQSSIVVFFTTLFAFSAITLDNTLVILSTVAPDAGRYYAQAVNDKNGENKTSQPITLTVESKYT